MHFKYVQFSICQYYLNKIVFKKEATPFLGIYPEKTLIPKNSCILVLTAALFAPARTWKEPKYPSTEEWIKKTWHMYTMEYYSAVRRNIITPFVEMCMGLETVIQSEVSLKEKRKYHILRHICRI